MEQDNMALGYAMGRDTNNGYGNGMFGGDWMAMWFLLAILGFGNGGFGGFGNNGGNNMLGYELGRAATQADVASGFSTSEIMSDLNDILMGQSQGFAGVQQTLCQGFNGINQAIRDCCCDVKMISMENRYLNERQTCDIIGAVNAGNQRIIDWLNCKENQDLRDQVLTYKFRESQATQNAYLVDQLRPTARPAYPACNPYASNYACNGFNGWNGNCCSNG